MIDHKEIIQFQQLISEWNGTNNYTEKSIEVAYYNLIDKYYNNKYAKEDLIKVKYNSPYSSDGIITIQRNKIDYSILIEAKYNKNYHNKNELITVLCQAVYYLKRLENEGELLPAVILLVSKNSTAIIRTEQVIDYLFNDYDWDQPANIAHTNNELYSSLLDDTNLQPLVYDLYNDNINDYLNTIDEYCNKSIYCRKKITQYELNNKTHTINTTFKYSDYGIMVSFNESIDNCLIYNTIDNNWYEYNGKYWITIDAINVKNKLLTFLAELSNSIVKDNNTAYYFRLSQKLVSLNMLNNVFELLLINNSKSLPLNDQFISLSNGDYDTNNSLLLPHNKGHYALTHYDYTYMPNGDNIEFYKMINRNDLLHNELIKLWFNEAFIKDYDYYVLNEDARDSYNNWLKQKGYATISHKNFLDKLENHEIFKEQDLSISRKSKVGKLIQSLWSNNGSSIDDSRIGGLNSSHIKYIKFK